MFRQIRLPALFLFATACGIGVTAPGTTATIESFAATPASITPGQPATITASFSNGIGVVDQGIGLILSGASVTVSPASTTTYTLTVGDASLRTLTRTVTITVASSGPPVATITASPPSVTSQTTATFSFTSSKLDSTFSCILDSGAAGACASPRSYSGLGAGSHTFTVTATDKAGQSSAPAAFTWSLDLVSPVATITASPPNPTGQTSASFSFNSSKAGSSFSCKLDSGAASACTSPRSYSGLVAGSHTFAVTASDPAGNTSSPASLAWTIDLTAPVATITSSPATLTNQSTASFSFSSSKAGSTFSCALDSAAAAACTSPQSYSGLGAGSHSFSVTATDPMGITSSPASFSWTINPTVLVATITGSPANPTNQATATFSFTSSQTGSTFSCALDSAAAAACTSPQTYPGLASGTHTFTLTATNPAGVASSPASFSWTIDLVAPIVTITASPPSLTSQTTATFSFNSSKPSPAFSCKLDAGAASACSNPRSYSGLTAGSHTFTVTATDLAGNTSSPASSAWTIDMTAPVATITASPANPTNQTTTSFSFSSSKAGSTFSCKLDSGAAAACTSPQSYSGLASGSHTFTVTATDPAGNASGPASFAWTIDLTPPVVTITATPANPTPQTTASFSFTSSQAGSSFNCKLDSGAAAACTSPQSYSGLANGSHTFSLTATDPAGNVSTPATFTWTITSAGGLVISTPLALDKLTVSAGDTLNGTVTFQNTSASPIAVLSFLITARAPGGTNAGGPYYNFAPRPGAQTILPGATVTVAASHPFISTDPPGALWWAYATYQDSAAVWHDGPSINFTVTPPAPVIAVTINPSFASTPPGGTITFQATVTGTSAGQSTAVTWSVAPGGGTIGAAGVYVAPSVPGSYTVTATSVADPTKTGIATAYVDTPGSVIPDARRTTWNPGIPGGIPSRTTICATINAATFGNGTTDATAAIQSAINACPPGQVVSLPAGTYATNATLWIDRGVVLRGAGPALTKINLAPAAAATVVSMGLWTGYAPAVALTANAAKGATSLTVANGSSFAAGDFLLLDQRDDPSYVVTGDCTWDKRKDLDGVFRSVGQTVEVASVAGNTLTLFSPVHIDFRTAMQAQVVKTLIPLVKNAGLEDLYVSGGRSGMILMVHAAYSWVKNVESDTVAGRHLSLDSSYRIVVRDSYFHHATQYSQGGGAYGVSINTETSDSLIENNVIYFLNKPFLFEASGGGNVLGYNYIDDAQLGSAMTWQETDVDTHCSFPHMELVEGNWAPHLGADIVHGNSGWLTFYRNYASSQHRTVAAVQVDNIEAVGLEAFVINMNLLGNVLGKAGLAGLAYENSTPDGLLCGSPVIHRLGAGAVRASFCTFDSGVKSTILRHGNFDYFNNSVVWDPVISTRTLPPSLYLTQKPAFFGSEAWPFVETGRTPMVGVLPAKQRYDIAHP